MSAIMYGTGNTYFDEWVDSLATTTLPQATSRLVTINYESGNPEGYCCMGQACTLVPDLSLTVHEEADENGDPWPEGETRYDEVGYYGAWSEMAPPELLAHLGIEHDDAESDIFVDLPEEYAMSQGTRGFDGLSSGSMREPNLGCSVLNDRLHLTFAQISDVLRYFGIRNTVFL